MNATRTPYFSACLSLGVAFFLTGCNGVSSNSSQQTPPPNPVSVSLNQTSVTLLAGAQQQFSATVQGTSNTAVTWAVDNVTSGNSSVGTITNAGLYTAPGAAGTHTVTATSVADSTKSASATVTVNGIISVSPGTATLSTGATQQFTVTVQGQQNLSVTWSVDGIAGGNSSVGTVDSKGLYTAPSQVGTHTVSASIPTPAANASSSITVYNVSVSPGGMTLIGPGATQQFNATVQGISNTGVTWAVDGNAGGNSTVGTITSSGLYTAPYATGAHTITAASAAYPSTTASTGLTVINTAPGAVLTFHNDDARDGAYTQETTLMPSVVNSSQFGKLRSYPVDGQVYAQPLFVPQLSIGGTPHNVVFVETQNNTVYAFDADGTTTSPLWAKNLGAPSPRNDEEGVSPYLGILSTPVIDISSGTMYLVATTASGPFYLHALDITSGAEKFNGPVQVYGTVPGSGWDNVNGTIGLEAGCYQRNGLALNPATNLIYIAFGHCHHGWLFAYDKTSLQQKAIFNDTPDGAGGGLWNGGGAPVIDDYTGKLFVMSGVDQDDPPSGYNDSFIRLDQNSLTVQDYFQPDDAAYLALYDVDLGSGSPVLMPDNSSSTPHEIIGGGKDGNVFVVNRDNMGQFSSTTNNVIETVHTGVQQFDNIFSTPAYWNGSLYLHCEQDVLHSFSWTGGQMSQKPVTSGSPVLTQHGATVSISANGNNNGIVWEIDNSNFDSGGPSVLRAYDATNVGTELYDSTQAGSRDTAGTALKFTVPTIANGMVFVGTGNELDIYGLLGK